MRCLHCHFNFSQSDINDTKYNTILNRLGCVIRGKLSWCSLECYRDFKGFGSC